MVANHLIEWAMCSTPAQFLYETGGTFAEGFGEVDLLHAKDGRGESRHQVNSTEGKPGDRSICQSPSLLSGEMSWNKSV